MTQVTTAETQQPYTVRVRGVPAWACAALLRLAAAARVTPEQAARLALIRGLLAWGEAYPAIRATRAEAGAGEGDGALGRRSLPGRDR